MNRTPTKYCGNPVGARFIAPVLCILFVLTACAAHPTKQTTPTQGWPLLAPNTLPAPHQVKQILRGAYGTQDFTLQCAVNAQPQLLTVVGLTALGLRAFTLKYDGQNVSEERAPQLPEFVKGSQLLNDVQLAFWPLPALQAALQPAGWEVSEPYRGTRRLQREGRLIAEVHYADADPWSGRLWLSNFVYGYSLYLETSPVDAAK